MLEPQPSPPVKKKKKDGVTLAKFRGKIAGRVVEVTLKGYSHCYGIHMGSRQVYSTTLGGLLEGFVPKELRELLMQQKALTAAVEVEKGLMALSREIGTRLDRTYLGLPPAQRAYAPPVGEAREGLRKLIQNFAEDEQEGRPVEWLTFLEGPAAYAERVGLRLCVLPIHPEVGPRKERPIRQPRRAAGKDER